jgi:hypothetical protein
MAPIVAVLEGILERLDEVATSPSPVRTRAKRKPKEG